MRLLDYLRMSWAGIVGHKRRIGIVVVVIGTLFGVLIAACMLTKGVERAVMEAQTAATGGKILLLVEVDRAICGEDCDFARSLTAAREKIEEYDGEMLSTVRYETEDGVFYGVPEEVFGRPSGSADDKDVPTVLASVETILKWQQKLVAPGASYAQRLELIDEVYVRRGETITSKRGIGMMVKAGAEYRISEILPSASGVSSLELSWVSEAQNALDLILANLEVGSSLNFVHDPNLEMREGATKMAEVRQAFAVFSDAEAALAYTEDTANTCSDALVMMKSCPKDYQFLATEAVGRPVSNMEAFRSVWRTLRMFTVILCVVAATVAVSTFLRILGGEKRTIALYYALGAPKVGVIGVYLVYFYMICIIAMAFALLLAVGIVLVTNVISAESLMQIFTLGFSRPEQRVFLIGWTDEIAVLLAVLRATALVSIVLGMRAFSQRNIVRKMK